MSSCKPAYFPGLADAICLLGKVNGGILSKTSATYTNSTFISAATHRTNISSKTLSERVEFVLNFRNGFEDTTDDPTIQTSNLNTKFMDGKPIPSALAYLDLTACDYAALLNFEHQKWDLALMTDQGKQIGTKKIDNTPRGFRVRMSFVNGLPSPENGSQNYPVYIFFETYKEFENALYFSPSYTIQDLLDYVPVGLSLSTVTAYNTSTGVTRVRVVNRCTNTPYTGLLAVNFPIRESNAVPKPVGVTALTEVGQGDYDITIQKDTGGMPADLVATDEYSIQVSVDDSTYETYSSNLLEETIA